MDRDAQRPTLKIISKANDSNVVHLTDAGECHRKRHLFNSEALAIEAEYGNNGYSDYLRKNGSRPTADEAAIMGLALGGRVRADDGSMQPPLSNSDHAVIASIAKRRANASRRYDQIMRLRMAIAALAANFDDPVDVISGGSVLLNDKEIALHLPNALKWLTRFAQEWESREATCAGSEECDGGPQIAHGDEGRDVRINR